MYLKSVKNRCENRITQIPHIGEVSVETLDSSVIPHHYLRGFRSLVPPMVLEN